MPIVTTKQLAQSAGLTSARISQLVSEGLPKIGRNQFDLEAASAWLSNRKDDDSRFGGKDLKQLRARLYELQGDNQSLRNDVLAGNVMLADTVQSVFEAGMGEVKRCAMEWIGKARTVDSREDRKNAADDFLRACERGIALLADARARGEDVAATRTHYRKRVGGQLPDTSS